MYASITAKNFLKFYVRVFASPVEENKGYRVYKIVGESENSGININNKTKGTITGKFMYLAITDNEVLYICNDGKLLLEIGPCCFKKDE